MGRLAPLLLSILLAAGPAVAVDLTGTWEGKFVCSEFGGSPDHFSQPKQALRITQTGDLLAVEWVGSSTLQGQVVPDAKSPDTKGGLALVDCTTSHDLSLPMGYGELASLQANVNRTKGKGSLKGFSIYSNVSVVGSCKWSFKLTDAADPAVPAGCP